jgi:hypothetical protein
MTGPDAGNRAGVEKKTKRDKETKRLGAFYGIMALPLLLLGIVEAWHKRGYYTTDAISYLDISRAIPRHDWRMVFNSLWSVGYPFLISVIRPLFPATAQGEWNAIHVLNLLILLFSYGTFLYLLRSIQAGWAAAPAEERLAKEQFFFFAGYCIFVCTELCINAPSRVSPDPLVDGMFFAAVATMIQLIRNPSPMRAAILGVILGLGYLAKTIFLPISAIILLVTVCALLQKRHKRALLFPVAAGVVLAAIAIPYAAGLSWALGRWTFGESGSLNYNFHVNLLPRYTNWQGGPAANGTPIHPTHLLLNDPPFFEFAEPFHNTYPPFGNAAYWYEGYRHFWSAKYQAIATVRNLFYLAGILKKLPIAYAIAGVVLVLVLRRRLRREWLKRITALWPLFLPPLLAVGLYVLSHLEDRYLAGYLATLALAPFAALGAAQLNLSRTLRRSIIAVLALGATATFAMVNGPAVARAIHHKSSSDDPEWKLAAYLRQAGLKPGDKVGAIGGPNAECTWAYLDQLRIVAEVGGRPYDPHPGPHDRWWSNRNNEPDDAVQKFWSSSPETQAKIMQMFQQAGAVAVISPPQPAQELLPGWQKEPAGDTWVYRF